jgi:hypothetical protein
MPNKITVPDPDAKLGEYAPGLALYLLDAREEYPLYRDVKLIATAPCLLGRRTARLSWIIHEQRFKRGGAAWALSQDNPALLAWCVEQCAGFLTLEYLQEMYDYSEEDIARLIETEANKYRKK